MKNVEFYILQIEDDKAGTEKKDLDHQVEKKEGENQIEEDKDRVEEIKDPDNQLGQGKERD
jgi:DNA repair exonuclease SbcCD ATPase subunit